MAKTVLQRKVQTRFHGAPRVGNPTQFRGRISRLDRDGYGVVNLTSVNKLRRQSIDSTAFFTMEILAEKSLRKACRLGMKVEGRMVPFGETYRIIHLDKSPQL